MKLINIFLLPSVCILSSCQAPSAKILQDRALLSSRCALASYSATPSAESSTGIGYAPLGGLSVAQSFMPNATKKAITVSALLQRTGTFSPNTHNLTATIESNTSNSTTLGNPDDRPLAISAPVDVSSIPASAPSGVLFKFTNPVQLNKSQIYWLRIRASYRTNTLNYISWAGTDQGTAGGYIVEGVRLRSVYETEQSSYSFSSSKIGANRFSIFTLNCDGT